MSFQSIMPPEAYIEQTPPVPTECCPCPYGQMEGHRDPRGNFVVERIISTDPVAYLDCRYAPGAVLGTDPAAT